MYSQSERKKIIVRTSIIGIGANILLALFKAAVGLLSHSIAVILDAVNNLSDALSSVITIVGTRLAGKKPDKKHPLGHGRIEYLSALVVAAIILYAGLTSLVESVKKLIHPEAASYEPAGLLIIAAAIGVKLVLGQYVRKKGEETGSGALAASGSDALFDAVLSASVLLSAIIYMLTGISLEAIVGVGIALVIIKSGVEMISDTVDDLLGHRADPELSRHVKEILNREPEVRGAYDLFINNYGPNRNYASVHLELPDTMTVEEVDLLTRRVQAAVMEETGVILTGVGVYSFNTTDSEMAAIQNRIQKIAMDHDWVLQMHGFFGSSKDKTIRFDVVLDFGQSRKEAVAILEKEIHAEYPDYALEIACDADVTD